MRLSASVSDLARLAAATSPFQSGMESHRLSVIRSSTASPLWPLFT